jgi:DNA invertase Pin-like site-specific DNA recombinase
MTRRAAIYARVSTSDQNTENQLIRLREVAARAGWEVVQTYTETASGAKRSRPALDAMMADAARRRFDVVMAWDVSRLGRSLRDLVDLFENLRALKVDLYLEQQALDTSTPAGRALLQMSGVFAEFERAMIVERTKAGLAHARARGVHCGRPPASDALTSAIRALREQRVGMDRIAKELRCGKGLVHRVCTAMAQEAANAEG